MAKVCLECSEKLIGRSDKKFCSDYCRNSFNNKVNKESKNLIRNTNNRLRKNYKILTELNSSGKTKVTRTKLFDKGFDFNHHIAKAMRSEKVEPFSNIDRIGSAKGRSLSFLIDKKRDHSRGIVFECILLPRVYGTQACNQNSVV